MLPSIRIHQQSAFFMFLLIDKYPFLFCVNVFVAEHVKNVPMDWVSTVSGV